MLDHFYKVLNPSNFKTLSDNFESYGNESVNAIAK